MPSVRPREDLQHHHDHVRQHPAQPSSQGGVPRPQDLDAAAPASHGQWVSGPLVYFINISLMVTKYLSTRNALLSAVLVMVNIVNL